MADGLWDRAAQPERTALAWTRTALALAGSGLLCVRFAPSRAGALLGAVIVCAATTLLVHRVGRLQAHRRRVLPGRREPGPVPGRRDEGGPSDPGEPAGVPDPGVLLLTAAVTMLVGVVGLVLALS